MPSPLLTDAAELELTGIITIINNQPLLNILYQNFYKIIIVTLRVIYLKNNIIIFQDKSHGPSQ